MKSIIALLIIITASAYSQNVNQNFLRLTGTGYFAAVNTPDLGASTGLTLEFWVRIPSAPLTEQTILGKNAAASWSAGIGADRKIIFRSGAASVASLSPVNLNTWTHVAITYDVGLVLIYFNGILNASSASFASTLPVTADSLFIGCDRQSGNLLRIFSGDIDAVRLWKDAARNSSQINEVMFTEFTGTQNTLLPGRYKGLTFSADFNLNFDMDLSGTPQPITLHGTFMKVPNNAGPLGNLDYNNNIYLDGNSYLVSKNQDPFNPTTALTITCWIKRDSIGGTASQTIICKSAAGRADWKLYTFGSGVGFRVEGPGATHTIDVSAVIQYKQWHHVAAVYSQSLQIIQLYVDGNIVAGGTTNEGIKNNADSIYVGAQADASGGFGVNRFKGQIDCIQVYKDAALDINTIKNNMYRNITSEFMGAGCELSFDNYPNMYKAFGNSLSTFNYMGNVKIVSSHENNDLYSTSPLLRQGTSFQGAEYLMQRKGFLIPDAGVRTDSILVPASSGGNLSKINVFVALNHTRIGDISVQLRNPAGTVVTLKPNVSNTANDMVCIFDADSDSTIRSVDFSQAPFSPFLKPSGSLASFNGSNAAGYWTLIITDNLAGNTGYLIAWGIKPSIVIGVGNNTGEIPDKFSLSQNYPNPFNPVTNVKFQIPRSEYVKLKVYDISGREAAVLVNENLSAGTYEIKFDGSNFSSGAYFYRLEAGDFTETRKMLMIK